MIYPIIYTIYAVFIPLTGEDRSVYGKFSNIWPSVNGSLSSLAYICAVVLLFIGTLVLH
jgi:hypothetical protein